MKQPQTFVFLALKAYLFALEKCPATHKNFCENPLAITILHFLASQVTIFPCAIQNIENQGTSVVEMKIAINKLLLKLEHSKSGSFFTSVVQDQLKELVDVGKITYEEFKRYCDNFYETCTEYVQEWYVPFFVPLQCMDWISLKKVRDWKCVQEYYCFIKTVVTNFTVVQELFEECSYLKKYCEGKLKE